MFYKQLVCITAAFFLFTSSAFSQGIKGKVYDNDGTELPYATIYVKELGSGTVSNENGRFELKLNPGTYHVIFRYAGYESVEKQLTIGSNTLEFDVHMNPQVLMLKEVQARAKGEDPAYAIMRKAIAKSKFHLQQIDSYTAQVYMKGKGRILDIPFYLRKTMKKEGIDSTTLYISESVSIIEYERPNKYNENVISIFTTGDANATSPNSFVFGSFYEDQIGNAISPLSSSAFSYYKFGYESAFVDQGTLINKIKVTPRVKSPNVFEGFIYIVEDDWSIYSLNLSTIVELGIKFTVNQQYAKMKGVWMPVSQTFRVDGKVFGVGFEYDYLASMSDYQITLNPKLDFEVKIIDEKSQKKEMKALIEAEELAKSLDQLAEADSKKMARKQMRKMIKEYEKEEQKAQDQPEVVSERNFKIDTLARKKDQLYWESIRPIPLSDREIKGYQKMDSLAVVEIEKEEGKKRDTTKVKKSSKFDFEKLISGHTFRLAKGHSLKVNSPVTGLNFNTVEGINFDWPVTYTYKEKEFGQLEIQPQARYSTLRNTTNGFVMAKYKKNSKYDLQLKGGRYIFQYNEEEPINPLFNAFTSLFLEGNFMKILEKDFLRTDFNYNFGDKLHLSAYAETARRYELQNRTTYTIIDYPNREITPNIPINNELLDTSFDPHNAFIIGFSLEAEPFLKYRMRNGRKIKIDDSSPKFGLDYKKGIPGILNSGVNYDFIQANFKHKLKVGIKGTFDFNVAVGGFLNNSAMFFPDFKHFPGNLTPVQFNDPVGKYRLLDYYRFSTREWFISPFVHYQFRKFLITQIPEIRFMGLKENILLNVLYTPGNSLYHELGYTVDNLFNFLRVEFITSFENGRYLDYGVRLGISTSLGSLMFD